jgi:isopenicillin N synthase-like dioxygenase
MAKALKIQETSEMLDFFKEGDQIIRLNYYPPCPQPHQVIGLNPHSDASALTILLQVNEMQGLQVKKDGMWIPINPLPNAFVVNVGDQLEVSDTILFTFKILFLQISKQCGIFILSNLKLLLISLTWCGR